MSHILVLCYCFLNLYGQCFTSTYSFLFTTWMWSHECTQNVGKLYFICLVNYNFPSFPLCCSHLLGIWHRTQCNNFGIQYSRLIRVQLILVWRNRSEHCEPNHLVYRLCVLHFITDPLLDVYISLLWLTEKQ